MKGIQKHNVVKWIKRKEGEMVIERFHKNGEVATSLPCVLCRHELERYGLKWTAFYYGKWVSSDDDDLPDSKPTSRQKDQVFGHRSKIKKFTSS